MERIHENVHILCFHTCIKFKHVSTKHACFHASFSFSAYMYFYAHYITMVKGLFSFAKMPECLRV